MCVLAPGLSLSIIIHSRVNIIDNERPGASLCDPRGRLHIFVFVFCVIFCMCFVLFMISIIVNIKYMYTYIVWHWLIKNWIACEQHKVNSPDSYIITYDFTFHVHIIRFHWDFFDFSFHEEAANRKQIVNIATRGTMW
jgi:hypothetical protein